MAGGSALAAPKPVCNLIVDPEGDGKERYANVLGSPALDILSADVATGKKELVGVIRLKNTQTVTEPLAYTGIKWSLAFQINGVNHSFSVSRNTTPLGSKDSSYSSVAGKPVEMTASVDGTSVTFKVLRANLSALKRGKPTITSIAAMSFVMNTPSDTAIGTGTAKYVDLTPSCLKPA